jgi:hypothetical protein
MKREQKASLLILKRMKHQRNLLKVFFLLWTKMMTIMTCQTITKNTRAGESAILSDKGLKIEIVETGLTRSKASEASS